MPTLTACRNGTDVVLRILKRIRELDAQIAASRPPGDLVVQGPRFAALRDGHPLKKTIKGTELIGNTCTVPEINREVPILAGVFADPSVATGIVMSVPAHAPYDWIALVESKAPIQAIKIIDVKGFGANPAKEACDQLGIKSQTETDKLNEATDLVYKKEFHTGVLNEKCGQYAGIKISDKRHREKRPHPKKSCHHHERILRTSHLPLQRKSHDQTNTRPMVHQI